MNHDNAAPRACPVCGAGHSQPHVRAEEQDFVRCRACGSLYVARSPEWSTMAEVYESPTYQQARGHGGHDAIDAAKGATTAAYLSLLRRHGCPGRVYLEVGCSAGAGLAAAVAAGFEVHGVEVSQHAVTLARRQAGVRAVHHGTVWDASLAAASFDVVTMFDVIEHIDPPGATLLRVFDLLRPGGVLLVVTPDAESLSARLMGKRWPHLIAHHVVCLSRRGLRLALSRAGFAVERVGFAWKRVNLDILVRHARLHPEVFGSGGLRLLGRLLPAGLLAAPIPFNIGECYAIARRPATATGCPPPRA